jgi:uncharacterized protein (TIGR04255 family)
MSEKKKYKANYLSQVICQLNYASVDGINDTSMKAYKELLGKDYGELAGVTRQGIIIQNDGSGIHTEIENSTLWQIESVDKTHTITIGHDNLAITFNQYTHFRDYIEIVAKSQDLFFELFPALQQIDRLGLRYINQVKPDGSGVTWKDYINTQLTEVLGFVSADKIRRSMHSMVIEHDEETRVNFNFGIFNQYFPAPIVEDEFILDLDSYTSAAVKPNECRHLIEKFNTAIAIYFEMSITDKLRNKMGVIDDESAPAKEE